MIEGPILMIDAPVNIFLGLLLLFFPARWVHDFGLPVPSANFYVNLLGGVLDGTGIALLIQRYLEQRGVRGLAGSRLRL
jgi:hypothetical protein